MNRVGTPHALNHRDGSNRGNRTLRIEKDSQGGKTTVRLIGHFQAEHIAELEKQIQKNGSPYVLDLAEVTLVDVDVVRFLRVWEAEGVGIVNCPPYIREWMNRERKL
jgi:hypothetical protein